MREDEEIVWVGAGEFIEAQTKEMEREFKCSRPRPRNRAMGFRGEKKKREWDSEEPMVWHF